MKRWIRACILVLLVMLMTACQSPEIDQPQDEALPPVTDAETTPFVLLDHTQEAVIVCSEQATKAEYQAAISLQTALKNLTDRELRLTNDFDADEDHSNRLEILVGETNRAQSAAAREKIDELQLYIGVLDGKLVVRGSAPRITAYAVRVLVDEYLNREHYDQTTGCLAVPSDLALTRSYYDAVRGNVLKPYEGASNGCEVRPTENVQPTTVPERNWKEGAYLTGETLQLDVTDGRTGGTQFIAKLFTEGLSRAPRPEEYLECTAYIAQSDCTPESLGELAARIFSMQEFTDLGLTPVQSTFAVWRAMLNRDPSADELQTYGSTPAADLARLLAQSREFSTLIPNIIRGPYFWSGNNTKRYTGERIMTADELQALLNGGGVVTLPQGTLVLCDKTVTIPNQILNDRRKRFRCVFSCVVEQNNAPSLCFARYPLENFICCQIFPVEAIHVPLYRFHPHVSQCLNNMIVIFSVGAAEQLRTYSGYFFNFVATIFNILFNFFRAELRKMRMIIGMGHDFMTCIRQGFHGLRIFANPVAYYKKCCLDPIFSENIY